ncbi:MAG: GntR family transcriptional regulator [Paracoccaceae bacterium]|nr:GntR family transcriptional regulator [Paracoccaceae bacterium]
MASRMHETGDILDDRKGFAALVGAGGAGQSAATRTLESLRRRIIGLELAPDTVLSRIDLARQYDISQTPLREALQRLEAEGLVEIYPQSRTVVTRIDTARIYEAHFLRIAVETETLRRLAVTCDDATLNRLKMIVTLQEALATNPSEIPAFQELDEVFHQTLLAAVGQPGLHALLRSRSGHLNRVRRLDMPGEGKIARILQGHRDIIAALQAHDPDAAQAAIREHLSQTVSKVDALRNQYPSYFRA